MAVWYINSAGTVLPQQASRIKGIHGYYCEHLLHRIQDSG